MRRLNLKSKYGQCSLNIGKHLQKIFCLYGNMLLFVKHVDIFIQKNSKKSNQKEMIFKIVYLLLSINKVSLTQMDPKMISEEFKNKSILPVASVLQQREIPQPCDNAMNIFLDSCMFHDEVDDLLMLLTDAIFVPLDDTSKPITSLVLT